MVGRKWLVGLVFFCCFGCRDENSALVARTFVDKAFVEIDREAAIALSIDRAREKLEAEAKLVNGLRPATEERPRVYYRELARFVNEEGVRVDFRLTVQIDKDPALERQVSVFLRRVGGTWRVIDYQFLNPRSGDFSESVDPLASRS